ncbi:MAG: LamG domain-containing protein [Candidatus Poribacteria bacterium]|nr:LamG domain-containing protein [Candidatus Poribacteria bacterium]
MKRTLFAAVLLLSASLARAAVVLELHFEEGAGDATADDSGNANNGTLKGVEWVEGRSGSALQFDGVGTHVEVADSASLQITDAFSIAAWVNFDQLGASGNHDAMIAKAGTWSFITFARSVPPYQFAWWDNNAKNILPGEAKWLVSDWLPDTGVWYHLAVTIAANDQLVYYVDGAPIKESDFPVALPAGAGQPVWIGKGNGATENFAGMIDDVMIFNETLDAAAVQSLFAPLAVEANGKLTTTWGVLKR